MIWLTWRQFRAQAIATAAALAIAKRPKLLILDEPVASLDPLARRDFLRDLTEATGEHQMSVMLSSHLVADLERVCDYLIVLAAGRVQAAGRSPDCSPPTETAPGRRLAWRTWSWPT